MTQRAAARARVANDVDVEQNWVRVHEALSALARERANLEGREGVWLLRAQQSGVHRHLGFGSFVEYVDHLFGYSARTLDDKLRTVRSLQALPQLAKALSEGQLNWSAVKELARVATAETETEWLCAAKGKRARMIEKLVSGRVRGDRPSDAVRLEAQRHVLRFEVSPETLATFREAMQKARQDSGGPLDDDAVLLLLARAVLERASESPDAGRASYQIAVMHCERCGNSFQRAGADSVPLEPEVAEMVACDAQRVGVTHVGGVPQRASQEVPPVVRRHVILRDKGKCSVPGCRHSTFVDVHHIVSRTDGGPHTADNLIVLCAAHHRAVHRGQLRVTGSVSSGLHFRHGDGTAYGESASASASNVGVRERVLQGLIRLGFRERDARSALERVGSVPVTPEEVLRSALRELAPSRPR
jgi:5-methylcytosine-specific restriction endonuclease McrA